MEIEVRFFIPNTSKNGIAWGFSRQLHNGKIKRYLVPISSVVAEEDKISAAQNLVREELEKEFEDLVELKVVNLSPKRMKETIEHTHVFSALNACKGARGERGRKAFKSLEKVKTYGPVYQYYRDPTFLTKYFSFPLNKIISFVNKKLKLNIPLLTWYATRDIAMALSLAVQTDFANLKVAINDIGRDLEILQYHGLIMGHFIEPSLVSIKNCYGTEHDLYTLLVSPIIDLHKAQQKGLLKRNELNYVKQLKESTGVEHLVNEGEVSFLENTLHSAPPFEDLIDETVVLGPTEEELWEEHQKNFTETLKGENRVKDD